MLLNISYNSDKNEELILSLVGKPYNIWSLIKIGKIGSPRLQIISASKEISKFKIDKGSEEEKLYRDFLVPKKWY